MERFENSVFELVDIYKVKRNTVDLLVEHNSDSIESRTLEKLKTEAYLRWNMVIEMFDEILDTDVGDLVPTESLGDKDKIKALNLIAEDLVVLIDNHTNKVNNLRSKGIDKDMASLAVHKERLRECKAQLELVNFYQNKIKDKYANQKRKNVR